MIARITLPLAALIFLSINNMRHIKNARPFLGRAFLCGFRVSPSGVLPFDYVRKRFSGFNRFGGFNGGGAAHKNMETPRRFETSGFLVSQT